MALTDTKIRNAKPRDRAYKLYDERGLFLLVQKTGGKWWRLKYRFAGKEKTISLGVYPDVGLQEARRRRDEARELVARDIDPAAERRQEKRRQKALAANSFEAVAREWHRHQKGRWSKGHAAGVIASLEKDVFPALGRRPVVEIAPGEVLDVIRAVERRGVVELPSKLLQRCSAVFRFAIQTGIADTNPAAELRGALKTHRVNHRAALKREELPEFLEKLDAYDGHILTRLGLLMILHTFVRSLELRGARWDEFDLEARLWRIPGERMKTGKEHLVPLSDQVLEILEQIRPISGNGELVFPMQNKPRKIMSENTLLFALYRLGYHGRATVHGFRATASTILNESGFAPDPIERQLAHVEKNKVRAAYHRSEYLEERRRMMQWWSDFIDTQREGGNVVTGKFGVK